jgi:hypothetical protein
MNGRLVGAALAISFALIGGIVAWIATHPSKAPRRTTPPSSLEQLEPTLLAASQPVRDEIVPAVLPAKPREVRVDRAAPSTPPPQPQRIRITEAPPPQPKNAPPEGETYGTSVLFLGNPVEAAETARRESKLLFVLHVSGNFEDSCFT